MDDALVSEFLMAVIPLVRNLPLPTEEKLVGRRLISFELKALTLLIKAL